MRRATRLLTLSALVLAWSAVAVHACERSKSANASTASAACATACGAKAMSASACGAVCGAKAATASSCSVKGAGAKPATAHGVTAAKKFAVTRTTTAAAPKKAAPATAGMRAYRDPETGTFGAPPQVSGIGEDGVVVVKDAPVALTQVAIPGGGYYVDLQGTGEDYATMRIDAKGNRVMTCAPARIAGKKKVPAAPAPAPNAFPEK